MPPSRCPRCIQQLLRCTTTFGKIVAEQHPTGGCEQKGGSAYEAHAFGSCGSGDYVHDDGGYQRLVGQRPGGDGASRVFSLDLGLLLFNQCAKVVLRVVEMVLESCTGVVPRMGWLGLGVTLGIA